MPNATQTLALSESSLKQFENQSQVLEQMCLSVEDFSEKEIQINKEIANLFKQKSFENFDQNDIQKLLWKINMSKYQKIFQENQIDGQTISLIKNGYAAWGELGIEFYDSLYLCYYFTLMASNKYSICLEENYLEECPICFHNTPEKTLVLSKEYHLPIDDDLILQHRLCAPVLTFFSLVLHKLQIKIISPEGKQIGSILKEWGEIHEQHLKSLQ